MTDDETELEGQLSIWLIMLRIFWVHSCEMKLQLSTAEFSSATLCSEYS